MAAPAARRAGGKGSKSLLRSAKNSRSGKYARQAERTAANKIRRAERHARMVADSRERKAS